MGLKKIKKAAEKKLQGLGRKIAKANEAAQNSPRKKKAKKLYEQGVRF